MASISVPCPKCVVSPRPDAPGSSLQHPKTVAVSGRKPLGSVRSPLLQVSNRSQFPILKAQIKEGVIENSLNSSPVPSTKLGTLSSNGKAAEVAEGSTGQAALSESALSTFMAEVSDLVKLVDARDITELQLKQKDCEVIIRKKETLPQPPPPAPFLMMQHSQASFPPPTALPHAAAPPTPTVAPSSAPAPALPPPAKGSKSSLPPLKCPMAGTFYRCPAPGEPPFVKVGDKVKKGQVVCIIEAMKLMNEIEADQSGTVIDILAEDGKPVSVDLESFVSLVFPCYLI